MPELPEVETTLRGIKPHILNQTIKEIIVREHRLRWPISSNFAQILANQTIIDVSRRAKYLLLKTTQGTIIIHLGMSGHLRVLQHDEQARKHDHVDIILKNKKILRFNDPRRFGAFIWCQDDINCHVLIKHLGIEPLERSFSGRYLWSRAQGKKLAVKSFLMDNKIVTGIGNIYATESLYLAGIYPKKPAGKITLNQYDKLAKAVKLVLKKAIHHGGTTLRDFMNSEGKPGYFSNELKVYGRAGLNCKRCNSQLRSCKIGQRTTVYCPLCQHK